MYFLQFSGTLIQEKVCFIITFYVCLEFGYRFDLICFMVKLKSQFKFCNWDFNSSHVFALKTFLLDKGGERMLS